MIRITVHIDPNRTALNQRLHWRERHRRNAIAKLGARLAWVHAGKPTATGAVRVSVIVRRARPLDPDNIIGALKPFFDGLFREGVTPDDSARWIRLGEVTQETNKRWRGREEVEFVIETQ